MKILVPVARILMGLVFLVFGLNHVVPFLKMPMPAGDAGSLMTVMFLHRWLLVFGVVEAAAGLMLLAGRMVPMALTLLAGVGFNILLFHFTLEPGGLYLPLFLAVVEILLVYAYRESFRGIFNVRAQPDWK